MNVYRLLRSNTGPWPILAAALAVCVSATQAFSQEYETGDLNAQARSLALSLKEATSDEQVAASLEALLGRLRIPVIEDKLFGEARGVTRTEVNIVSKAFRKGTLTSLDDLALMWGLYGLRFGNPAQDAASPFEEPSGIRLEKALRALRQKAARASIAPFEGLLIAVVDELGKREDRPFDLMAEYDGDCSSGAGGLAVNKPADLEVADLYAATLADESERLFAEEVSKARAQGENEYADMLEKMHEAAGFKRTDGGAGANNDGTPSSPVPSFLQGLTSAFMPMLDKAAREAGASGWSELSGMVAQAMSQVKNMQIPSSQPIGLPAYDDVLADAAGLAGATASGDVQAAQTLGPKFYQDRRKAAEEQVNLLERQGQARLSELRERTKQSGAEETFKAVSVTAVQIWKAVEDAKNRYRRADHQARVVETQQEEIREESELAASLTTGLPVPKQTSCIYLDAVQLLLVQANLFGLYDDGVAATLEGR